MYLYYKFAVCAPAPRTLPVSKAFRSSNGVLQAIVARWGDLSYREECAAALLGQLLVARRLQMIKSSWCVDEPVD
jgi:hypothetical protein